MASYSPVPYVYREIIEVEIARQRSGKIFFFNKEDKVDSCEGTVVLLKEDADGIYIYTEPEFKVRIDRIITLFGRPGAAFDEYDSFANQCLSCTGGYEI